MSRDSPESRPEDVDVSAKQLLSAHDAMQRYRCLTAHLIAESLGYFTPRAAALAVAAQKNGESFGCEWYADIAMRQNKPVYDPQALMAVNRSVIEQAFMRRHRHTGYMAEYQQAKALVQKELDDTGSTNGMLASWF